tara:strand:+ start:70 stop:396 length:327 start_codon:yes stop_codon:yes gene_type:complete
MTRVRFLRQLLSLLEVNNREDLIPLFEKHIKTIKGEVDSNFEDKFKEMLVQNFKFSKYDSSRFLKGVYNVENYRHNLKSRSPKNTFKYVTGGGRPVQGGSPGLGKGKS